MKILDPIRSYVKTLFRAIAKALDKLSSGKITPNQVTVVSTLLHLLIAYTIYKSQFMWAGGLLIVFGLMDTLDGELARLQGRASDFGVLLDAVADRVKETIIYIGIISYFALENRYHLVAWSTAALGFSIIVTFTKAKGEALIASNAGSLGVGELNRLFGQNSLMRFEIRMALIVLGLFFNMLAGAVIVVAVMSFISLLGRLQEIRHALSQQT